MSLLLKHLTRSILLSLICSMTSAQTAPTGPINVTASELGQHSFQVSGLKLTIINFQKTTFTIHAENTSKEFLHFSPEDLVIVGSDGNQRVAELRRNIPDVSVQPVRFRIAPTAHMDLPCWLSEKIQRPAKLYFGDKLLAVVTN